MTAVVNKDVCKASGDCVEACPTDAIKIENDKAVVDPDLCADCGGCERVCPTKAIKVDK
jgi:NAD-dependent dihydropyrimidine dehydrogenase PreA subunit